MWLAIAIACLVAAVLLLLWVPLDLVIRVDVHGRPKVVLRVGWFFGLVSREIKPEGRRPRPKEEKPRARRSLAQGRRGLGTLYDILRTRGILRQVARLVKDVLRQIKFRRLEVDMRLGLDDPADTGFLFGLLGPATVFVGPGASRQIRLQPVFGDAAVCEGHIDGSLRLQPIRLVPPILRFMFSAPTFRLARSFMRRRWKRN